MNESEKRIFKSLIDQIAPDISPAYDRDQIAQIMKEIQNDDLLFSCYSSIMNRGKYTGEDTPQQLLVLGYALGVRDSLSIRDYSELISQIIKEEKERFLQDEQKRKKDD